MAWGKSVSVPISAGLAQRARIVLAPMLASLGFSLQGNAKVTEGNQHADRDAQFRYLAAQVAQLA